MASSVTLVPYALTSARGTFNTTSSGFIQGDTQDQPHIRNSLRAGVLSPSETLPMWGGVAITAVVPGTVASVNGYDTALGMMIQRATAAPVSPYTATTTQKLISGFSVNDQNYASVQTPQSPPGLIGAYGEVNWYPLGSGALIKVACDPSLASFELTNPGYYELSWDFNNSRLQPYDASTATYSLTSITWSGGVGTVVAPAATPVGAVGDVVYISDATNSGTGGNSAVNGSFTVASFTDSQHFTLAMPAASGVIGTIAGTPVLNYGTGLLPCFLERLEIGNSMTVSYNSTTGQATWNYTDSVALIRI